MLRRLRQSILFLLLCGSVCIQARTPLRYDSTRVEPVEVTSEAEKAVFRDESYVFKEDEIKHSRNFIQDIIDWFTREKLEDPREREERENTDHYRDSYSGDGRSFWDSRTTGNFIILLCILIVVGGLVYLIWSGKLKTVFTPKPAEVPFDFKEIDEDIGGMNIDRLIDDARKKGDLRLATRWWYLKLLQKLTLAGHITWKPHKTNFDYYRELRETKFIQGFKQASHVYEYVWYGEMPVNEEQYSKYTSAFADFERSVNV